MDYRVTENDTHHYSRLNSNSSNVQILFFFKSTLKHQLLLGLFVLSIFFFFIKHSLIRGILIHGLDYRKKITLPINLVSLTNHEHKRILMLKIPQTFKI